MLLRRLIFTIFAVVVGWLAGILPFALCQNDVLHSSDIYLSDARELYTLNSVNDTMWNNVDSVLFIWCLIFFLHSVNCMTNYNPLTFLRICYTYELKKKWTLCPTVSFLFFFIFQINYIIFIVLMELRCVMLCPNYRNMHFQGIHMYQLKNAFKMVWDRPPPPSPNHLFFVDIFLMF